MRGEQQHPGAERGRHAGGQEPVPGDQVQAEFPERLDGGGTGRGALSVQHKYLAVAGVEADHRHLARWPAHVRLDHLQHQAGRHRGVEGVAALLQHRHAGRGRQPVGRSHHAERARELRPGGERGALRHHLHPAFLPTALSDHAVLTRAGKPPPDPLVLVQGATPWNRPLAPLARVGDPAGLRARVGNTGYSL